MALRYELSLDNAGLVREEPTKVVPRRPAPVKVEFRPGANFSEIAQQILAAPCVQLSAAVGAGKSVNVPACLAKASKGLVVHCVPNPCAAFALHEYVKTLGFGVPMEYRDRVAPLPERGVVFCSTAVVVRQALAARGQPEMGFPSCVLFLDESHESEVSAEMIRTVGPDWEGVRSVVLSSATFDPDGARRAEPKGTLLRHPLPDIDVTDWDPEEDGQPWSVSALEQDTLIFMDHKTAADKLHLSYQANGFLVYRIHARMTTAEFASMQSTLREANRRVAVILADYSFRSSLTFPSVGFVIDSGLVRYYDESDGVPAGLYRRAFLGEVTQALGRGARAVGQVTHVWGPAKLEPVVCDLERVEMDAAAILYRLFGYKPPRKLANSMFAQGDIPDDLEAAFKGRMPLFAWPKDRYTPFVGGVVNPPRPEVVCEPVVRAHTPPRRPDFKFKAAPDGTRREFRTPSPDVMHELPVRPRARQLSCQEPRPVSPVAEPVVRQTGPRLVPDPAKMVPVFAPEPVSVAAGKTRSMAARIEKVVESPMSFEAQGFPHTPVEDVFGDVIRRAGELVDRDGPEIGKYCYFPGVEVAKPMEKLFPGGLDAVHRLVRKSTVIDGWGYDERMCAMRGLVDSYNEAVARYRAVEQLAEGLKTVGPSMTSMVDASVVSDWVCGLSEQAVSDKASAASLYESMRRVFSKGILEASDPIRKAMADRESAYVRGYVGQLEAAARDRPSEGQAVYARALEAGAYREHVLESTKRKLLQPSERRRYSSETRMLEPANSKELVSSGPASHRTVGKYKFQPASGLPSLVARALFKAVGEGDVKLLTE